MTTRTEPSSSRQPVIRLRYQASNETVVVVPEDEDRFTLRVQEAIEGCKIAVDNRHARARMQVLMNRLGAWLKDQAAQGADVKDAYLTMRDGHLTFIVVQNSCAHNPQLEDELSELDWQLSRDDDLKVMDVQVFALPDASEQTIDGFLHPRFNLKF